MTRIPLPPSEPRMLPSVTSARELEELADYVVSEFNRIIDQQSTLELLDFETRASAEGAVVRLQTAFTKALNILWPHTMKETSQRKGK